MQRSGPLILEPGVINARCPALETPPVWEEGGGALYSTLLYCTALHCTALHCTALHFNSQNCSCLYYIELYCNTLNCTVVHDIRCKRLIRGIFSLSAAFKCEMLPSQSPLRAVINVSFKPLKQQLRPCHCISFWTSLFRLNPRALGAVLYCTLTV